MDHTTQVNGKEIKETDFGKEYYNNDYIRYEGKYQNDQKEGYGKYVIYDGSYYIGEWKDDIINGIGIEYYPNGSIRCEGNYIDGQKDGIGKFYFSNGEYCVGQFKNNYPNGKGIQYYKNGTIRYEGDL